MSCCLGFVDFNGLIVGEINFFGVVLKEFCEIIVDEG